MDLTDSPKQASSPASINSISFCPAPHTAESFGKDDGLKVGAGEDPSLALLRAAAQQQHRRCSELLHTSLPKDTGVMGDVLPKGNGFVDTVIEAYNRHRALVVRPDDVWLAILTQFCFFVNGNAEALRSTFVAHEGKKELVVVSLGNRYTMDPAYLARRMTELMQEHIVDPSLQEWIMPNFTTTTMTDRSISAIVMMGTMKEYFSYKFSLMCGIPGVTLEGDKSDWEEILRRLEGLKKYGIQTNTWYHLLRPVISRFVTAYDDPTSPANLDFWSKVAHRSGSGSGPRWLSGWITAFCVFDEKGRWQGNKLAEQGSKEGSDPLQLSAKKFASTYVRSEGKPYLALDGFPYPTINSNAVPCGYVYVDVKLDDNGTEFDTMFVAGLVGSQICSTSEPEPSPSGSRNTVRPLSAWWYFIKGEEEPDVMHAPLPPIQSPPPMTTKEASANRRSLQQDIVSRMKGTWDTLRKK